MSGLFSDATAVTRLANGRYAAEILPGWDIAGNANGGYVLAMVGRAMANAAGRPPLTVTGHYLAPAPAGPCEVTVETVRAGRRFTTLAASLVQGDVEIVRALGTFGTPARSPGGYVDGGPPELPAYEACVGFVPEEGTIGRPPFFGRLGIRLRPGDEGFHRGQPTGRSEVAGWFAFQDHEPIDEIGLLLAADAFSPAVFNSGLPIGWVPTVELTVHVRGVPAPGRLRGVFRSRFATGGLLDEDGELWDSTGTLVAQSRQLALLPRG